MDNAQELISQIAKEVLNRLGLEPSKKSKLDTLAVFTGYVFNEQAVTEYLKKRDHVSCVLFGDAEYADAAFDRIDAITSDEKQTLASKLEQFRSIVLVTPPLSYIKTVAAANDDAYECMLALRPLLWGKNVTMLMDFALPRSKRGFAELSDSIDTLENMGMSVEALQTNANGERKELVTEQDVLAASKGMLKSIRIMPNAIVTALARDTANKLGIRIEL